MRWIAALALVLAGCGHTYSASLGMSRRGDGTPGAVATVGADVHLASWGWRSIGYFLTGVRVGVGVDADHRARVILDLGDAFGSLPRSHGSALRFEDRLGTTARVDGWLTAAWSRSQDDWELRGLGMAHPYVHLHFAEVGVEVGAEKDATCCEHLFPYRGPWYVDVSLVGAVGWVTASESEDP